ncbi:MAG: tripartite tricarboxylate transporter permease [Propionibacteriaceae bacterium]|nr:tripartite tricarboxylate transporter permease [Propionibacteriaceae bacterium]
METLEYVLMGFATALQPGNLVYALVGCILGQIIGILPGLGPIAGMSVLLPLTFYLDPTGAIIMLAAIYYGSIYGGTISAVLIGVPGEGSSAITAIDGFQMAKQGRGGSALGIAAIGSFAGGLFGTVLLICAATPLAKVALSFGPPEMFALLIFGLSLLVGIGGRSVLVGVVSGLFGLLLILPGADLFTGQLRFTFNFLPLYSGLDFVPVVMGVFGVGEILRHAHAKPSQMVASGKGLRMRDMVRLQDLKDTWATIVRGGLIGVFTGIIPGIGTVTPTIMSYSMEQKMSKTPERFGKGAIQGVAGPETGNNAFANSAFVPMFTLGIPGSPTLAVLMGAFMLQGLTPGPRLMAEKPEMVWGIIVSMIIGNFIMLILNLPLVRIWVKITAVPYNILFPTVLALTMIGSYSVRHNMFDVVSLLIFGVFGYIAKELDFPVVPIILTLILGPMIEKSLRQSIALTGDGSALFRGPISITFLALAMLILTSPIWLGLVKKVFGKKTSIDKAIKVVGTDGE